MKKMFFVAIISMATMLVASTGAFSADKALFSFEEDVQGWEIPDWAYEQDDYVGEDIGISNVVAKTGKNSMKLNVNFSGGSWRGAVCEVMEYYDFTPYGTISCDIFLPEDAPLGLKGKMILTVGDNWQWTEMSRSYRLKPGEWTHISANFKPGSSDWKRTKVTDEFRADIRKIAIRVESSKPAYNGPIYIDNVTLSE